MKNMMVLFKLMLLNSLLKNNIRLLPSAENMPPFLGCFYNKAMMEFPFMPNVALLFLKTKIHLTGQRLHGSSLRFLSLRLIY
jgi:hypothetical protein